MFRNKLLTTFIFFAGAFLFHELQASCISKIFINKPIDPDKSFTASINIVNDPPNVDSELNYTGVIRRTGKFSTEESIDQKYQNDEAHLIFAKHLRKSFVIILSHSASMVIVIPSKNGLNAIMATNGYDVESLKIPGKIFEISISRESINFDNISEDEQQSFKISQTKFTREKRLNIIGQCRRILARLIEGAVPGNKTRKRKQKQEEKEADEIYEEPPKKVLIVEPRERNHQEPQFEQDPIKALFEDFNVECPW
ncbi:hypothetical protein HOD08_01560 [bacterium]|nr:hypothetical protein [bacterium]